MTKEFKLEKKKKRRQGPKENILMDQPRGREAEKQFEMIGLIKDQRRRTSKIIIDVRNGIVYQVSFA